MSYYPAAASHYSQHQPVVYAPSHQSHHVPYASTSGYYEQPVVYGPQSGGYHPTPVIVTTSDGHSHRRRRSHHHHHHHHSLTWGERLRRFFGFGNRHYKIKSRNSSWGFLGRSRRRRYTDAVTGREVDRHGREIYTV